MPVSCSRMAFVRCPATVQFLTLLEILLLVMESSMAANGNIPLNGISRFGCPQRGLIKPCSCFDKNRGLDITCEGSTIAAMKESLGNLAQSGQTIMYLKLTRNHLNSVPYFLFEGLNVIHIIANYNNITTIEENSFAGMDQTLESLDLSQNSLFQVPSNALKTLTSLISLNIGYNSLEILPARAFGGLISLLRLSLFGNKITSVDDLAFEGIGGNLTRINLGGNLLTQIPSGSLRKLSSLQILQLHKNKITHMTRANFYGIQASSTIDTLNLAENLISEIPSNCFLDLHSLNSLDLEGNQIHFIHQLAFAGIQDTLEWLKLAGNKLDAIPTKQMVNLTNLRELDFRENNITAINEDSFLPFGSKTKFLYLQKNRISHIDPKSFDSLTKVEWVYIHSNQLKTLSRRTFEPLLSSVTVFDIHNNPFRCDCDVLWFREFINSTSGSSIVSLPGETRCESPVGLSRVSIGQITSIPGCSNHCHGFGRPQQLVILVSVIIASHILEYPFFSPLLLLLTCQSAFSKSGRNEERRKVPSITSQ